MKNPTRECCPTCGSDSVDLEIWTNVNTDEHGTAAGTSYFCNDCSEHLRYTCRVDVGTGKCVVCCLGDHGPHAETFKPRSGLAEYEAEQAERALALLIEARGHAAQAGTPKVLARVRLAISSAKGALSNARHRASAASMGHERRRIRRAPRMRVQTGAR